MNIERRTFAAKKAATPEERAKLNLDAGTSEYMPSYRYMVREPFPNHPTQKYINHTFRTKEEAQEFINKKLEVKA